MDTTTYLGIPIPSHSPTFCSPWRPPNHYTPIFPHLSLSAISRSSFSLVTVFLSHLMAPSQRMDPQTPTSYNRLVIVQSQGEHHLFRIPGSPWLYSPHALSAAIPWLVCMHEVKISRRQCLLPGLVFVTAIAISNMMRLLRGSLRRKKILTFHGFCYNKKRLRRSACCNALFYCIYP